ncbi:MAG: response regulator [Caldilinea sp. CFX5]|nr:response regulator [Caldilinea sp. CFX5]
MKREQFVAALRSALMQLDDYQNLRHSPLLPRLGQEPTGANPVALQRRLVAAINALQDDPTTAHAYPLLHYRYVEHLSQAEVAFQLGVSVRQLRRDQNNAIELLAEALWQQLPATPPPTEPINVPTAAAMNSDALEAEVDWLRRQHSGESSDLTQEVQKALADATVLAATYRVHLQPLYPDRAAPAAVPPLVVRQTLLTLLSLLIPQVAGETLTLRLTVAERLLTVSLALPATHSREEYAQHCHHALQVAAQLLTPFHGAVCLPAATPPQITITLPKVAGIPVLLVDDNPDIGQLLQRYAAHSRFQIIPVADARQTIALAQAHGAQALVIDVMMPDLDGWDLLAQVRHHPATQALPIAVCTILPQQELARLLGATHFLQKPISQERWLTALNALVAATATRPD